MEAWVRAHSTTFPRVVQSYLPITTQEFVWSVALIFLAFVAASFADLFRIQRGASPRWSVLAVAVLVANAFTHLLQALVFGGYTPGVITAGVLVLPFGGWVYRLGRQQGWLDLGAAVRLMIIGGLVQIPLAPLALAGGRMLAG